MSKQEEPLKTLQQVLDEAPEWKATQEVNEAFNAWVNQNVNLQRELKYLLRQAFEEGVAFATGWKSPVPHKQLPMVRDSFENLRKDGSWLTIQQLERMAKNYMGMEFTGLAGTCGLLRFLFAMIRDGELAGARSMVGSLDGGEDYREDDWYFTKRKSTKSASNDKKKSRKSKS